MTVIAYRDRTLAGDSAHTERGTIVSLQSKLTRFPSGVLYGAAGDSDDRALLALLKNVKTPEDIPSADTLRALRCDVLALLVFPDGAVWRIETGKRNGGAEPTHAPCAIGSGSDLAMGAMLRDPTCSAAEACDVACQRDMACREPIHTLSVDDRN